MDYLATFLEGVITFVSPCLLPMLPLFIAYFAGASNEAASGGGTPGGGTPGGGTPGGGSARTGFGARIGGGTPGGRSARTGFGARIGGFVLGFTLVFVALGATAGALGGLLAQHGAVVNLACGIVVIVLGLHYAGVLKAPFLDRTLKPEIDVRPRTFASSMLFGIVFAVGWTPCVGVFLGSALALAAVSSSALRGTALLLCYSLGLAIPFVISAFAIDRLARAFDAIKRHYATVNAVCGWLLVVMGILMATGQLSALFHLIV